MSLKDKNTLKRFKDNLKRAQSRFDKSKGDSMKRKLFSKDINSIQAKIDAITNKYGGGKKMTPTRKLATGENKVRMSDIMGGSKSRRSGPAGPMGGKLDKPKIKKKKASRPGFKFLERRGSRLGQFKSGGMLGDLDKDGTMSRYEQKRQSAIEKSMAKQGKKGGGLMAAIKKVDAKRMYGGGMTVKKMRHGGKTGKCPRDGIAMRGKTRAGRKRT